MKRSLIILPACLFFLFFVFSLIDRSEYAVEKRLWKVGKKFNEIARDPKVVPDLQFEDLVAYYKDIIRKYPKSILLPKIYLQIGRVYTLKRDYDKARINYGEIIKRHPQQLEACAVALMGIGQTYEVAGNEAEAIKIYQKVAVEYPLTDSGLNAPIYIANYYFKLSKNSEAMATLDEAVRFYKRIIKEHSQGTIHFNALRILATAYLAMDNWEAAVDTFENILFDYGKSSFLNGRRAEVIIRSINLLCLEKLKKPERAIQIYQNFIEKNPKDPLSRALTQVITLLKNVTLKDAAK